jgi:hypothetical protein
MKIRSSFVSNSSSSSFIMVGVNLSEISSEQRNLLEENGFYDTDDLMGNETAIGKSWSASDYETETISLSELNDIAAQIKSVIGDDVEVSVMFGERYS